MSTTTPSPIHPDSASGPPPAPTHGATPDRPDLAAVLARLDTLNASLDALRVHLEPLGRAPLEASGTPPLLTIAQVAARLQVSERTVERILARGVLKPVWVEGQRRFTDAAVEAYLRHAAQGRRSSRTRRVGR
jgi:excisionase family DNA binding protein